MSENNIDLRETHTIGPQTREQIVNRHLCNALGLYAIHLTGLSYAQGTFTFIRPCPTIRQVLVCLSGSGEVWVDGRWVECSPGMAYITQPGVLHAYHTRNEGAWQICWVMYKRQEQERTSQLGSPMLINVETRNLALAIKGLYREAIGQGEPAAMHAWAQLVHIHAQRMFQRTGTRTRLQNLWDSVNADIAYPWTSQLLAERAGISEEHLRRLCQQTLKSSPMKYVTALRMRHAAVLLSSEAYTVASIARRVGYENSFAFSTAFKRIMGISPTNYREQARP